jgi:hypothetical protein
MPQKDAVALALASGRTIKEAAKAGGTSERTAYRYLADDDFRRQVTELRTEMLSQATGRLSEAASGACIVLILLLGSKSEAIRLRAARTILDLLPKFNDASTINERLEALEKRRKAKR